MTSINISSCLENPQSELRNAFQRRNLDGFKIALVNLQANPNHIDTSNGITIFEDILQTPNTASFITLCIDNGADLYSKNSHGRYALHYAAESLSSLNLKAFLARYDRNKINVKYYDKNSLHLIIELLPKLNDFDYENGVECVKILVDYGCSVNMPNDKSRTPFNLLLRAQAKLRNKYDLVDYILKNGTVDLYTYREKEMIELFEKNNPHHKLPTRIEKKIDVDYMESLIRKQEEENFIADYQKFKELNEQENDENKSNNLKEILAQFLYRAVEYDRENIVQFLIDDGADVNAQLPSITKNYSTVELACLRGNYRILEILCKSVDKMSAVSTERRTNILHIITKHFGMDPSRNPLHSYEKCFEIAIKHCDKKMINQQDENDTTPLHYAARYQNESAVLCLLKKGAYIGTKDVTQNTPIDCMTHNTFKKYLDECITAKPRKFGDEEQEIIIDYNFLMPPKKSEEFGPEIGPLENITKNQELRPLIAHPVLASYLFLKWSKLSLLFHLNLALFGFFIGSLIYYIVLSQTVPHEEQDGSYSLASFKIFSIISIIMIFLRELFQFILSPQRYLKSIINYFEIGLIILGIVLISNGTGDSNTVHMRILRAVTILFAAYELLQHIGTLPYFSISTHMVILKKVALTFLKSLVLYSTLIFSFALCFFSLFGGAKMENKNNGAESKNSTEEHQDDAYNSFGYPGIAIIKTMVMLTGEFDAASLGLDENNASYSIIFLLFVFLMTIVLFNLLNALAIEDTQQIKLEGELVDLCERIKVLSKYEETILSRSGRWQWLKKTISIFPYGIPLGKVIIRPDKNNEIFIYKEASSVTINIDEQELQSFNNNNISLNKKLLAGQKPEKYSKKMDGKVMKKIRKIFDERKENNNDDQIDALNARISSLESEIRLLKSNIQDLIDLLRRN